MVPLLYTLATRSPGSSSAAPRRLLIGVILLALVLPAPTAGRADPETESTDTSPVTLYVATPYTDIVQRLIPLNPMTLEDAQEGKGFELGSQYAHWSVSADGTTLVAAERSMLRSVAHDEYVSHVERTGDVSIFVRDATSISELTRIEVQSQVRDVHISPDGTRVVIHTWESLTGSSWFVFDAADGQLLTTLKSAEATTSLWLWSGIGSDSRSLYYVVADYLVADSSLAHQHEQPRPAYLVAHDLTTGDEIGRLELSNLQAGMWSAQQGVGNHSRLFRAMPGVALSPDGSRIAIAHADSDAVTLIDTQRLEIERTVALTQPLTLADRLRALLPLLPQAAEAKASEGKTLHSVFAADGRHLYIFGTETVFEDDRYIERHLGLRAVDLESGMITAEALADERVQQVLPVPDGHSVYVASVGNMTNREPGRHFARRLDADTLDTQAERRFTFRLHLHLQPGVSHE